MNESVLNQAHSLAQHYENFPVAPFFLPKKWREPILLIYAFARMADDIADEGDFSEQERRARLESMHLALETHTNEDPFFVALNQMIEQRNLPKQLFHDLLDAFIQDLSKNRYASEGEIFEYCRRSANPIGRLLLHLTGFDNSENLIQSDALCTALQLINFLQDIASDLKKRNRLYIPLDDLRLFQVSLDDLQNGICSVKVDKLIYHQWERADRLLSQAWPLRSLPGLFGFQVRLTLQGGSCVLNRLRSRTNPYHRPTLRVINWFQIVMKALVWPSK